MFPFSTFAEFRPHLHLKTVKLALALAFLGCAAAWAGGPKFVAGTTYFNAGVLGQPVHWQGGQVDYFVDQGPLNDSVTNQQATAMVDAAAALWNAIPTAAVQLIDKGPLNEDVNGANIVAATTQTTAAQSIAQPADVTSTATNYPVGVIFDADGSVIDALFGTGASAPTSCQNNGVFMWLDNVKPDATIAHGIILLNGLCATNDSLLEMMSFEVERAFGRILGLDYAQVNPNALQINEPGGTQGWPVMQPLSGVCSQTGGACIPNPNQLRIDDIAAVNRIYPVTAANLASFPGKQITAANTVSIQGTVSFAAGQGMQGVNVAARPLDASGNPLYQYTVSFVTGSYFTGQHGNPVTGWTDTNGNPLTNWGSNDAAMQGYFDLSGMPLPPGVTSANYQVSFEAVSADYINSSSVGPYQVGQVNPSGSLQPITVPGMAAGSAQTLTVKVTDSAEGGYSDAIGTQVSPRLMAASGQWCGRLSQVGQSDWFNFPVRGNRTFTVVTQAVDETGAPTDAKSMPAIGIWDAFDLADATPVGASPGLNGWAVGESWLRVSTLGDDVVRVGISDQRGDGRPDYAYNAWVLYADSVMPLRLPAGGGAIVIHGMGFRRGDTVLVGGQAAIVTSISPNEITAIAPAAASGVTGSVDVEVDDLPIYYAAAIVGGGVSYDSGTGDSMTLVTAPMNTVPIGEPNPFAVTALGSDMIPAGGVTVIYTVTSGTAVLGCGQSTCSVTTTGDGHATMSVTATDSSWSIVIAKLTNGASLKAEFKGGTPATLAAVTPTLSVAAGMTVTWTAQALALKSGLPSSGQSVNWKTNSGIAAQSTSSATNINGIAAVNLTVGPLAEGTQTTASACLNGSSSQCVTYTVMGARPEYALLEPVSGTVQSLAVSGTASQITLRLLDMNGNPMAGGTVSLSQALYAWAPHCPPHGRCAQAELLATQVATGTSALDGSVTFTPASLPGVATNLVAVAASGNSATVQIAVEQHP